MKWKLDKQRIKTLWDNQGYYWIIGICVCIVLGAAVFGRVDAYRKAQLEKNRPIDEIESVPVDVVPEFVDKLSDITLLDGKSAAITPRPTNTPLPPNKLDEWPIKGKVLREYAEAELIWQEGMGYWSTHDGIDIETFYGEVVRAVFAGKVKAVYKDKLLGNVIEIERRDGMRAKYCGLATLEIVKVGDNVEPGQAISAAGNSAYMEQVDGVHLHFELFINGKHVNPREYLP